MHVMCEVGLRIVGRFTRVIEPRGKRVVLLEDLAGTRREYHVPAAMRGVHVGHPREVGILGVLLGNLGMPRPGVGELGGEVAR